MIRKKKPNGRNGAAPHTPPKPYWFEERCSEAGEANRTGRPPKFPTPDDLWTACCEYFKWVEENPLYETKAFSYKGDITKTELPKKRAMTIGGMCLFLGIDPVTWTEYRTNKSDGFTRVCRAVEQVIYTQKFTGAAADLLNPSIIARELGLKDAQEVSGPGGGPVRTENTQKTTLDLGALETDELVMLADMIERLQRGQNATGENGSDDETNAG